MPAMTPLPLLHQKSLLVLQIIIIIPRKISQNMNQIERGPMRISLDKRGAKAFYGPKKNTDKIGKGDWRSYSRNEDITTPITRKHGSTNANSGAPARYTKPRPPEMGLLSIC